MAKQRDADIRISNAERDEAITTLGEHLTTGRLELPEYEERCDRAAVARTRGELEDLFTDLPAPHPDLSSATTPAMQRAGQLVRVPGKKSELVATPASKMLEALAGVFFLVGIPSAILFTIFMGLWWLFIPVGVGVIVFGSAAEAAKKPPAH